MEIQILGSAAAEGIPSIFCECDTCREAWKRGGKDIRGRTAYKLSDTVRVDFGPDSLWQEYRFALHSERLRHLILTHGHEDHLYSPLLEYRRPGFAAVPADRVLTLYAHAGVFDVIRNALGEHLPGCRLDFVGLDCFVPREVPEEDMTIHPLAADHGADVFPLIYVIRRGGKHILIGNDTGYFPEATWDYLAAAQVKLDLVILDCTSGQLYPDADRNHMGINTVVKVRDRLAEIGSVSAATTVVANHFSHNGHMLHEDFERFFQPRGIEVGFDGRIIEL
jgi:phosphoribosyl 1,2-cyclic phosphate phosphodiesterase